jgi:IMP dehydrogenase
MAEGIEGAVPFRGSARHVIGELAWSIRQGMGYVGARNIKELRKRAEFVIINSTRLRNSPHLIKIDPERWRDIEKRSG